MRAWSVDFVNLVVLLYIGILFQAFFPSSFWIVALMAITATVAFAYVFSIRPARKSAALSLGHPLLKLKNLEFRSHPSFSFFAATFLRRSYIMIPEWRAEFDITDNEPSILHEFAHLKRGDTLAFTWMYPLIAAFSMGFILLAIGIIDEPPQLHLIELVVSLSEEENSLEEFRLLLFLAVAVLPTFVLFQMLLLMRDREYGADRYAFELFGDKYVEFISHHADSEQREKPSLSPISLWRTALNAVTHPTFKSRKRALKKPFSYTELVGLWSGLHFAALLTFTIVICVIFAVEIVMGSSIGQSFGVGIFAVAMGAPNAIALMVGLVAPLLLAAILHGSFIVRNTVLEVGSKPALIRLMFHITATTSFFVAIAFMLNYAYDGNIRAEEGWLFDFRRTAIATGLFFLLLWVFWSRFWTRSTENRAVLVSHCLIAPVAAFIAAFATLFLVPSLHDTIA